MDSRLEDLFDRFASHESWRGKCVEKLREAVTDDGAQSSIIAHLVGEDGARGVTQNNASWKAEQVWGIDINTCYKYCGRSKFPMVVAPSLSLFGCKILTSPQGLQLPAILGTRDKLLAPMAGPNGSAAVRGWECHGKYHELLHVAR